MKDAALSRVVLQVYLVLMLAFLLLPLIITAGAAFNDSTFPSVWPWKGWTLRWFADMWNSAALWNATRNTLLVGLAVMVLAVPIGTAAALILDNLNGKTRGFLYGAMTAPILTPGAVVGISTLIFWRQLDVPSGLGITTLGQVSVIAAYVMLLVLARLQSLDRTQEEAALDLGASYGQVIRLILLPHIRPALLLGAVIAFLQSIESYNVPVFTRGNSDTLMIFIASQARTGLTPMINALAFVMIAITVIAGLVYELFRRREMHRKQEFEWIARRAAAREELSLMH